MKRREFVRSAALGSIPLVLPGLAREVAGQAGGQAGGPPRRPNFLFIYTDDQRWDALSVVQREQGERARFPWFETPNMDRIANEGVRFRNAFVVNSLCAPSRACFLTGRYNHLNGVVNNHMPFPVDSVTHATLLRAAGYRTGYIGKWHMDTQRGQRPGFDYSASFIGQGRYVDCPMEINGQLTPTTGWIDDVSTDYAIGFMQREKANPFSLVVGYKSCHGPWEPPARWSDRFAGKLAKRAPNADAWPPYPRGRAGSAPSATRDQPAEVPVNLNYFRTIAAADENIGRLLKTLDDLGLAQDTVVVFSSDNGYYLGEHGLGDKRSAYDESMRIPLLVRYPGHARAGRVLDAMALNIDLAPTLLDYAGVPVPKQMQGRSWRPLIEGKPAPWRKAFFYEYFYEQGFGTPTITAVRTDDAKLVKYPGHDDWTELYDLKADPNEMRNLARDPAQRTLHDRLEAEYTLQAQAVGFVIPPDADKPEPVSPPRAPRNAYVLDYRFEGDKGDQGDRGDRGDRVTDASGLGNHGRANGVPLATGRNGHRARRFDGNGWIEVPKTNSLDPSRGAWSVEAVVKAEAPNGVILARGGASQGYALFLDQGLPSLTVTVGNSATTVSGRESILGAWTTLAGVITQAQDLRLYVNGKLAGSAKLPGFIAKDPNDGMQIGADTGSPVVEYKHPGKFVGLIESVRLYSGELAATALQAKPGKP